MVSRGGGWGDHETTTEAVSDSCGSTLELFSSSEWSTDWLPLSESILTHKSTIITIQVTLSLPENTRYCNLVPTYIDRAHPRSPL
jgi:hypothetical protein